LSEEAVFDYFVRACEMTLGFFRFHVVPSKRVLESGDVTACTGLVKLDVKIHDCVHGREGGHEHHEASQPKFLGRVPQQQDTAPAPATRMRDNQPSPAVPQRVVLYEEDSSDSQGKRYDGLVRWRTETVAPGQRPASELAVRADVEIPERRTTMT
jgi:hypothetical protein